MPRREIFKFYDEDDQEWVPTHEGEYTLKEGTRIDRTFTLKELADFCDLEAESRNNGEYVGTHRILAMVLFGTLGPVQATRIMQLIAEYGGLDGMSGVGRQPSAFADFGIQDCWEDWNVPSWNA